MVCCLLGFKSIQRNTELAESNVVMDTKGKILLPTTDIVKVPRQYREVLRLACLLIRTVRRCHRSSKPSRSSRHREGTLHVSPFNRDRNVSRLSAPAPPPALFIHGQHTSLCRLAFPCVVPSGTPDLPAAVRRSTS